MAAAGLELRNADHTDLPIVRAILRAANEQYRDTLPAAMFDRYLEVVLNLDSRFAVSELIVATRAGRTVGTVTFYPDASKEGWGWPCNLAGLRAMAVAPEDRRTGAGTAMAIECRRRAERIGGRGVGLHTASFLVSAISLYERLGFVRHPALDRPMGELFGYQDPALDVAALAYRLELT